VVAVFVFGIVSVVNGLGVFCIEDEAACTAGSDVISMTCDGDDSDEGCVAEAVVIGFDVFKIDGCTVERLFVVLNLDVLSLRTGAAFVACASSLASLGELIGCDGNSNECFAHFELVFLSIILGSLA